MPSYRGAISKGNTRMRSGPSGQGSRGRAGLTQPSNLSLFERRRCLGPGRRGRGTAPGAGGGWLANLGAIPGLVGKPDLLVVDEHAHNSIQEGAKIARANGVPLVSFSHCDPDDLERALTAAGSYRVAVVAIDGVYSMSGALPPLAELNNVCLDHNAVLYVDDAHGTGVLGPHGRGTVLEALGSYDNVLVVGSLSKAFSCAGGFIGCSAEMKQLLKMRSNTYIFGGPVPPPLDSLTRQGATRCRL